MEFTTSYYLWIIKMAKNNIKIKLLQDSRDIIFARKYGQIPVLPTEYNVDTPHPDTIQPAGNVMCTAITTCDIAVDQTGVEYDWQELFSRIPSNKDGADPRDALKEAIKNGLRPTTNSLRVKHWKSFWRADDGGMDKFDNIRSAIFTAQSPIALATPWYYNWINKSILPFGDGFYGYHMYSCEGWTEINSEPHLIIDAWLGRKMYMSRSVCNAVMSTWGSQAWVLATDEITEKQQKTIMQKIVDALVNVVILLKAQILIKEKPMEPAPVIPQPEEPKLYTVAKSLLGKRLTLDNSVPKNVGCAQALSYILKEAGYAIPKGGISGTYTLYEWLQKNFLKTDTLEKGNIIISVTGTGNGKIRGHVGVLFENEVIASNDSDSGLLDTHWKYENWKAYYQTVGKLRTVIFKPKV